MVETNSNSEIIAACPCLGLLKPAHLKELVDGTDLHAAELLDGVSSFMMDGDNIIGVESHKGEMLSFIAGAKVSTKQDTVAWVNAVIANLGETLKAEIQGAIPASQSHTGYVQWALSGRTQQAVTVADVIVFCREVEAAMNNNRLEAYLNEVTNVRDALVRETINESLKPYQKSIILNLITQKVAHITFLTEFMLPTLESGQTTEKSMMAWKQFVRCYLSSATDNVHIKQQDNEIPYGYRYHGNYGMLVHTPLTFQAYAHHIGTFCAGKVSQAYGPAGTGKTETIKDLARALGKDIAVINCSDDFDVSFFSTITALVKTGSWVVCDEFNRLVPATIEKFMADLNIPGIFITMNPGYQGKYPEEVKSFGESIPMTVPDYERIAAVMLYSTGIIQGNDLADKLVDFFRDCRNKLSKACQYDFGLRQLRSVVRISAALKRIHATESDESVLFTALHTCILPPLTTSDQATFIVLCSTHFPGVTVIAETNTKPLKDALTAKGGVYQTEAFQTKVVQLKNLATYRHGCSVLGANAFEAVEAFTKEVSKGTLTKIDIDAEENMAGLEAKVAAAMKMTTENHSIVLCTVNDYKPEMMEFLNTVIDDNKKLMLQETSIPLLPNSRVFTVLPNMDKCSPAFVSRNGVVLMQ